MTRRALMCGATGLLLAVGQMALGQRGFERGLRSSELGPCDAHFDRGRISEATNCYRLLLRGSDTAAQAEAHWQLGDLKSANERFREAVRLDPENPDLRVRWGHLYIDSHQQQEAAKLFDEALKIDAEHIPAQLGMARVLASRFEGKAVELVEGTLKERPRQAEGHLLLARMALEEGDLEVARESLESALSNAGELGIAPLETFSMLASLEMLEGNPDNDWVSKALDYNPRYGQIYADQAHFYVITRRYREATERREHLPSAVARARRTGRQPDARGPRRGGSPAPRDRIRG